MNPPKRPSGDSMKAVSAARERPLPKATPAGPLRKRLRAEAENKTLNAVSILGDMIEDFRRSDRFFKYKAFVLAGWAVLSVSTIMVACPGNGGPKNTLHARLVQTRLVDNQVMMIVNESGRPWTDVVVVVNHQYRASVGRVPADVPDNNLTLEPHKLLGEGGKVAPNDLVFRDLEVRTRQGEADLLVDGQTP